MRNTAERYIEAQEAKTNPLSRAALAALLFGLGSIGLYIMLYVFNYDIRHLAELTNQGDKSFFLLPIGIALVFSVIHGAFTGHFWNVLGLQAKS